MEAPPSVPRAEAGQENESDETLARLPSAMLAALKPYQRGAVLHAARHRRVMVADEPGMGKTLQALAVAEGMRARHVLVLCPLNAAPVWAAEAARWTPHRACVRLENPRKRRAVPEPLALPGTTSVGVATYDSAVRPEQALFHQLRGAEWDLVVADECHLLQDPATARSAALATDAASVLQRAPAVVLLSGTPQRGRPRELWVQLRVLYPDFMDFNTYCARFCGGKPDDSRGSSNEAELAALLGARCLARSKAGLGLPPKRRVLTRLSAPAAALEEVRRARAAYAQASWRFAAAGNGPGRAAALQALKAAKNAYWLASNRAKSRPEFAPLVRARAAAPGKIIFFAHQEVVREWLVAVLRGAGHAPAHLHGGTSAAERARMVAELADPAHETRIGVFSIRACGVAATCSPGVTRVVFWELMWTPGDHDQAEDRVHRLNTTAPVEVEYLCLQESTDPEVVAAHAAKRSSVAAVVVRSASGGGGAAVTNGPFFGEQRRVTV